MTDPQADVYSLGMTAPLGVHGANLPFPRILRVARAVLPPGCPEPLKKVLSHATSLERRYKNAGEFIEAVQHGERTRPSGSECSESQRGWDLVAAVVR